MRTLVGNLHALSIGAPSLDAFPEIGHRCMGEVTLLEPAEPA